MVKLPNRRLLSVVVGGLFVLLCGMPAHAQGVLGICVEWNPDWPISDCQVLGDDSPLGIALTSNTNPSFSIAVNDGAVVETVHLLVLLPETSTTSTTFLNFEANFVQGATMNMVMSADAFAAGTGGIGAPFPNAPKNQFLLSEYLGLNSSPGDDWHFNSINNVQFLSGIVGYSVYDFDTGIGVEGITINGGTTVQVSFTFPDGGFPVGTIFLSYGVDYNGNIIAWTNPLTTGLQIVPEPTSMLLLGSGLAGLGLLRRRRYHRSPSS